MLKPLLKLELLNMWQINQILHTKDKKAKWKLLGLAFAYLILIGMVVVYVGLYSYGYITIGLGNMVPAYLVLIASMLIFAFGIFKVGSVLYNRHSYELLCAYPIVEKDIILARFLRLYIEDIAFSALVLIPGFVVYGYLLRPNMLFYIFCMMSIIVVPMIPIVISTIVGTVIYFLTSKMKNKTTIETVFTLGFALLAIFFSFSLSSQEEHFTIEMISDLSAIFYQAMNQLYPPAIWLGDAILNTNIVQLLLCVLLNVGLFILLMEVVSRLFKKIIMNLNVTSTKSNYQLKTLQKNGILKTLIKKELKRYFSSSSYVTNTIIGPIMGTGFAIYLLFGNLPPVIDFKLLAPYFVGSIFAMMSLTSVSISLEGKNWWITRSLPITTKDIMNGKIGVALLVQAPFYIISVICLMIANGFSIFTIVVPFICLLFSNIFGLFINLYFPNMHWESDVTIVKQSMSAMIGGLGAVLPLVLMVVPLFFIPVVYIVYYQIVSLLELFVLTLLMYNHIIHFDLNRI